MTHSLKLSFGSPKRFNYHPLYAFPTQNSALSTPKEDQQTYRRLDFLFAPFASFFSAFLLLFLTIVFSPRKDMDVRKFYHQ